MRIYPNANGRTYLTVPYRDTDSVQTAGARWDQDEKNYYIETVKMTEDLEQYISEELTERAQYNLDVKKTMQNEVVDFAILSDNRPGKAQEAAE